MKSIQPPAWARTTNVTLAAAVSVLGIPIESDQSVDTLTGRGWTTLLFGMESVPYEECGIKPHDDDPLPSHQTKTIVGLLRTGKMAQADPHHPSLDVMRACNACDAIELWIKKGTAHRLVKVSQAERYMLVPGDDTETVKQMVPGFVTRSIKIAATLCVLGFPLLQIKGSAGSCEFAFPLKGYGLPAPITADLVQAFRTKRLEQLEPEHPMLWMMQGLSNRDGIREFMSRQCKMVLIRAPGTGRASLVPENANHRTMDRVRKNLRIP